MRKEYTVGRVAHIMNVARTTVHYWIDHGHIKASDLPGNAHRIAHDELVAFMNRHSVPLDFIDEAVNRRILIVDDDPEILKVVGRSMERKKFNVWTSTNGIQAGMLAQKYRPHAIILDIKIEGIDGRDVCKILRSDPELSRVRIIALSGRITKEEGTALVQYGFDGYMNKPVDLEALYNLLRNVMGKRRERRRWRKYARGQGIPYTGDSNQDG